MCYRSNPSVILTSRRAHFEQAENANDTGSGPRLTQCSVGPSTLSPVHEFTVGRSARRGARRLSARACSIRIPCHAALFLHLTENRSLAGSPCGTSCELNTRTESSIRIQNLVACVCLVAVDSRLAIESV